MICSIIGCGPSGQYWDGKGYSIGVNDCFKFGKRTDILLIVNTLNKYPARKRIVEESRPKDKLYGIGEWCTHPNYRAVPYMNRFVGVLEKGKIYKSKTSPFIAVTLAYSMGYDKIILWGVDFDNHPIVNGQYLKNEIAMYAKLQDALLKKGCSMYLGCTEEFENQGALKDIIPNFRWIQSID